MKRKYLFNKKDASVVEKIGGEKIIKFDDFDLKILRFLAKNSRMSLVELETKLKKPVRTIAFRIKQLERMKLFNGIGLI